MKRYLVFSYESYYPEGGWTDFRGSVDELSEVVPMLESRPDKTYYDEFTHVDVVDTQTWQRVALNRE